MGEVARPGDVVQFFRAVTPPAATSSSPGEALSMGLIFGTIPSTVDFITPQDEEGDKDNGSDAIHVYDNCFGALSEHGLSFTKATAEAGRSQAPLTTTTKLDVPFSKLTVSRP